jgi:hypothetical protein
MIKSPLKGLIIRTALVRKPDLGFIYACDPKKQEEEIPHAVTFKWKAGEFIRGECNYDAHSVCEIEVPEAGLIDVSQAGYYSANTRKGMTTGDLFELSQPTPRNRRVGGVRSVSEIAGKAYAVGYESMVYRMDDLKRWTRIDDGLPEHLKIEAIHGFDASDLYAVGLHAEFWRYDGIRWKRQDLPTNRNLNIVKCAGDGQVYIGGHGGILIRGRGASWEIIDHQKTEDHIWDLEWFEGQLYVSTLHSVYQLRERELATMDFGDDPPGGCYQLSSTKGVMWSNGEYDIMSFDGRTWTRVV